MAWKNVACAVILVLISSIDGQSIRKNIEYQDYEDHPCRRPCVSGEKFICEYDFHLEYFITMGKACEDCPGNMTHCYNRGCITADGYQRYIMTVNQMLPGPALHVCEDDLLVVRVHNNLRGRDGTTIHWHGVHMKHQQHMDGTPMVTQCRIQYATSFEYRFKADTPGTHYWHAHSGSQRTEGIFGSLVIRQPLAIDPHAGLYNHDFPEHTMVVMEWYKRSNIEVIVYFEQTPNPEPATILLNGRGVESDYFDIPENRTRNFLPVTTFNVQKGQRYRFRVSSNGIFDCPIQMSIDNHTIAIIATDGSPVEAVIVESFFIQAGDRFDFVLDANQEIDNYWIRLQGTEIGCAPVRAYTGGILRYIGAADDFPEQPFTSYEQAARTGKVLNKWNVPPSTDELQLTDLVGLRIDPDVLKTVPDKKFYLSMSINLKQTYHNGGSPIIQINHISYTEPSSPPLTQYKDLNESIFCNENTMDVDCTKVYCECVHRIKVALNDVVELIVVDEGPIKSIHQMHLHGHNFYLVGQGKIGETETLQEVKRRDEAGQLTRNLVNPILKDTASPSRQGYVVFRWHATNPGFWLFHCHMQLHLLQGQSLIFQVGDLHEMPQVPRNFPRCGHWHYTGVDDDQTDGVVRHTAHKINILCILIYLTLSVL